MTSASTIARTAGYKPGLAWFAAAGSAWVFVLVTLGALTTSIGAGMAFADWPLSNGSLNPSGWLENLAMFAEHSHRLSGLMMGLVTIGLVVALGRWEERAWLRRLGWTALVIVVIQGLLGGLRVVLNDWYLPGVAMSLGEILRIPHGILAQLYVCLLLAIAVACSRLWIERAVPVAPSLRRYGLLCCGLLLVQLTIAATMRHNQAGLAIPYFPYSTRQGSWLPAAWDFRVGLNFAHRLMAVVLTGALCGFAWRIHTDRGATLLMRLGATLLVTLLSLQILLGAEIIWTLRAPDVATGHVAIGALLLAATFLLTWLAHRDRIEAKPSSSAA
jgi:heme a synthase